MDEGDGAREPFLIASGRIVDQVMWYIPVIPHPNAAGEIVVHAQILSYRTLSLTVGEPVFDTRRMVVHVPEEETVWSRSLIRELALDAARARADATLDQFLYFFLYEDRGTPDPGQLGRGMIRQFTDPSLVTVEPGYVEPPGIGADEVRECWGTPVEVAWCFSVHVFAATRRTWMPTPARLSVIRPPPQIGVTVDVVSVCGDCGRGTRFWPCCCVTFCPHCSAAAPHGDGCAGTAQSVPVPPVFRTEGGDRVPRIYVEPRHPLWQQYRFISGDRYVLSSFYNTADAHFFDAERGIRFEVRLYRREGPGAWGYRVDFLFRCRPTGAIDIRWNLYAAAHYAGLWP